jgi:hypothetical protein
VSVNPTPSTGSGTTTVARKKIYGVAGGKKGDAKQGLCDTLATGVNDALDQEQAAKDRGDYDAAAGWRQYANELLAVGDGAGCRWYAARVDVGATTAPAGTLVTKR